jgi:hypothetical protein
MTVCVTVVDDAGNTVKAAAAANAISYQQKLHATMLTLVVWQDNCNLDQPDQILLVKKILYYICRMQHCQEIFNVGGDMAHAMLTVDSDIPCLLHLHKLVVENVMYLIYALALNIYSKDNKKARLKHA